MGPRGMMVPGSRMTGPPPPYPQSGSRGLPPGAMISPNPGSPATSLPLSSPVMMNSPRHMGSNPGTPVSGAPMTSPVGGPRHSPGLQGPPGKSIFITFCKFSFFSGPDTCCFKLKPAKLVPLFSRNFMVQVQWGSEYQTSPGLEWYIIAQNRAFKILTIKQPVKFVELDQFH